MTSDSRLYKRVYLTSGNIEKLLGEDVPIQLAARHISIQKWALFKCETVTRMLDYRGTVLHVFLMYLAFIFMPTLAHPSLCGNAHLTLSY